MGIQFDPNNKWIKITSPTTEVSALEIYNAAMDWCDDLETMGYDVPIMAVGRFDMGGGIYSDSIFMLINGYKIKFWSGTYQAVVSGTLLAEPGQQRTVPPDSGNVEVVFQVSSQGILSDPVLSETEKQVIAEKVWLEAGRGVKLDELKLTAALEQTLTQIKGSGWTDETLKYLKELIGGIEVAAKAHFRI